MVSHTGQKVKIAGAGPAGLTAAICLAKAGHDVHLYEAREAVGARFIGDFQILENSSGAPDPMKMLNDIGIAINFFVRPISCATLFDHRLRARTVSSTVPFCYMIRRGAGHSNTGMTLDQGLLCQALEAGASIYYKTRIDPSAADIVATGPRAADGLAKEITFTTDRPDTTWVLFDMNYAPGGYVYLFVVDGQATFGCAITRDLRNINRYFDLSFARFLEIAPMTVENAKTGYSFMDFRLKSSAVDQGRMYVGEAGGFQDYFFGLGLRYALMTGYWAATSVMEPKTYDDLWQKTFSRSQEISLVNRALYEWGGNWGLSLFLRSVEGRDWKAYLTQWQADSLWKRMLLPFVKWGWKSGPLCRHAWLSHWCRTPQRGGQSRS